MKRISINTTRSLFAAVATLLLPVAGFAQTTIGSWQTGTDEGWIDWGNQESITAPTNTATYSFPSNVVAGFDRSLQVTDAGYNQNLAIKLQNSGFVTDFMNNHLLTFTFSVPGYADSGATAGFSQLFELVINAQGYGFTAQPFDDSQGDWSTTGDTGGNNGNMPNFYFYSNSPPQSQTVTLDYSDVLANTNLPANPGWVEFIFAFNNGGGAPAYYYINDVVLSGGLVDNTLLVNAFDTTNEVSDWWQGWFGEARDEPTVEWDSSDAGGDPESGSLQINGYYPESFFHEDGTGPQLLVYNDGYFNFIFDNTNGMPGYGNTSTNVVATNISFDLRFDPISDYVTNSVTNANWPTVEVGARANNSYDTQPVFGTATMAYTNTGWAHFDIPIGPSEAWTNIHGVFFKIWGGGGVNLDEEVIFYVDNIEVTLGEVQAAPTLEIEQANPALRMFFGNSQYRRTQVATVDTNQSWVGGTYPVSYSFTISDYPVDNPLNEFHMFLIPLDSVQGGGLDQFTDFSTAENNLRLQIVGETNGLTPVIAELAWKTNLINSNPDHVVATLTNDTAIGTWTLSFSSATAGTVTPPGASPVGFSLPAAVPPMFANPLVALFGVQPNGLDDIGSTLDLTAIQTVNVAGSDINTDFTTGTAIDTNVWLTGSVSDDGSNLLIVGSDQPWWVHWDFTVGFGLATKAELGNDAVAWKSPNFFSGYDPNNAVLMKSVGARTSALIPEAGLPTTDGTSNGVPGNAAFFRLESPPPAE